MTKTEEIVQTLTKQIDLVKELEQSRLFEKAEFMAERVGRNLASKDDSNYWILTDKSGEILADGTRKIIDRWIERRKLVEGVVYFKI